jgi:protein-disulfide isomerase
MWYLEAGNRNARSPDPMLEFDRRQALALTAAFAAAALTGLGTGSAWAQATPVIEEMSIGDADAPVTMVEYAMFTCPHCAAFTRDVLPQIKANYIDTGKVRLVFREVYFNKPSLWAAMIARCAPQDRYFGVAELLFQRQMDWAAATDENTMIQKLMSIGRQAGMTDDEMNACLQERAKDEAMVATYQRHAQEDGIDATPVFFINGVKVDNAPYEEIARKLDEALGA